MSLPPDEIAYQESHINDDRSVDIYTSTAIMLALAYATTTLRFFSRRLTQAGLKSDDWMILLGTVLTTLFVAGCYACIHFGMGKHAILIKDPITFAKVVLATETLLSPGTFAIKISILLLYRRVFPSRRLRILLIYYGVFLVIFLLAQVLSVIFQCSPVAALWDPTAYPDARCDNYVPALILLAVVNVVTDLLTLAIPLPILWKLKVSSSRRWQLIAMFSLGGLTCVVGICRCAYIGQVSRTEDPSWDDVNTIILSTVENCAGVLSANLPTLLPIWQYLRHGRGVFSHASPSAYYERTRTPRATRKHRSEMDEYELNSQGSIRQLRQASTDHSGAQHSEVTESQI